MADNKSTDEIITGDGIRTSAGVVLLSCELTCRVCGHTDLFEWPEQEVSREDVEGMDTLSLIISVAHSRNWIVQRVININDGKRSLFVLCPTCLALFYSMSGAPSADDDKEKT